MQKAIVIIPTYNERENIELVISKLLEVFEKISSWKMEILVVDDTSPDKTFEIVEKMVKKNPIIHLLMNQKKAGLGTAYLKGMAHAFGQLGADTVFEFDADLSHDATKLPEFLKKIDQGYDLVLGSRYIKGGGIPSNWGVHRKILSVLGNLIISIVMTNFSIRDWTGGFRALKKEVYQKVHPFLSSARFSGYTFQIGFLYSALKLGFGVAEVPFKFVDRTLGRSKMGPEYIKNILLYIFNVRFQELVSSRIFKFVFVGGVGALLQLGSLQLYRTTLPYQLAFFLSIETAVVSNFILNNAWTFSDRKLSLGEIPSKFIHFNMASAGSIAIQQLLAVVGQFTIGLKSLFVVPIVGINVDTGMIYAVLGIFLGMFWNFFAYNKFIWKK
jgi:dolichol-phosphate mannosyltransferase